MNARMMRPEGRLYAKLIKEDGTVVDYGELKDSWYQRLWSHWRGILGLAGATALMLHGVHAGVFLTLVTDTGILLVNQAFITTAPYNLSTMKYHDSGTGTTGEIATQTALVTPAGPATRAVAAQTAPTGGSATSTSTMQSIGTITYAGSLAITEWGLFDTAAQGTGNMWDRRKFTAINVTTGQSIQFTYTLTLTTVGGT